MKLFKKREEKFLPENHISVTSERELEKLNDWIKNNPPKFKKGDEVKVEYFYGGDFWGHWAETEPEGIYKVVAHVKMRCNYNEDGGYFWKYILKDKNGDYEIAGEHLYNNQNGNQVTNGFTFTLIK